MRSRPSRSSSPALRTTSRTPGFSATSQTDGAACGRAFLPLHQHLQRRVLDVGHPAHVERHDARLVLRHERVDLVGHVLRVGEVEAPLRPQDQQALEGLVVGVFGRQRPQNVGPALADDDRHARAGGLAGEADERHDDRHDDALQRAEHQDPEHGDDRPAKLHRAHPANGEEFHGLDQPDRVDDDDRRERRVGQQAQQRREQQHGRGGDTGGDERRLLRPTARGAHDRGLRGAAAGRHRSEKRPPEVGGPGGDQLAIRFDRRIVRPGEGAARRDRLGEAHQRDPERARDAAARRARDPAA